MMFPALADRIHFGFYLFVISTKGGRTCSTSPRDPIMYLETLLMGAYVVSGFATLSAYAPQIVRYLRDPATRRGISRLAWAVWSACALVDFLYVAAMVGDVPMMICTGANAAASFSMLGLSTIGISADR